MHRPRGSYSQFLVVWSGQLLSRLGSGISAFSLGVVLYQRGESASAFSLLLLCAFLPSVLLSPIGGVVADRADRKLLMIFGDIGAALSMLFVIVMAEVLQGTVWPIYFGVAMSSVFVAFHSPAFKASVTDLLQKEQYAKASGLIQLAEASRYLLAPVIAAFLMTQSSLRCVLWIDVLTFIAAALSVALVRKHTVAKRMHGARTKFRTELRDGIRVFSGNKAVLSLLCLTTGVTFFTGILQALFAPIVLSFADAATLGTVQSISASGMLLSSVFIGVCSKTPDQGRILGIAVPAAGFFFLLIGTTTDTLLITLCAFCFFITLPFVNTSLEVLFRQNIGTAMQGRAWSLVSLISQLGMVLALAVAGPLADHFFEPLLSVDGRLAQSIGHVIGTGTGRGSGMLVVISGGLLSLYALFATRKKVLRSRLALDTVSSF
jgi:MFS transporter, DHA3 family, macrolide efflux protein